MKSSILIKIFICLYCFIPTVFSETEIKINSVQIRGPFPNSECKLKGCLYTTICCDCKNAKKFTNDYHIAFNTDEIDLVVGQLPIRTVTGSTELEQKMFYDIGKICDGKEVCKFGLHPSKYGAKYYVSKAYEIQIEYTCNSTNNLDTSQGQFTDTFENPNYNAYISCIDSIKTTQNKATFFDMTTNFKRVAFSAATAAIANIIKDHYFDEEFFDSFIKW